MTVDPVEILLAAVNAANPKSPLTLNKNNVALGEPAPMTAVASNGANTVITLSPVEGKGFFNQVTIYYPRVDLAQRFVAAGIRPILNVFSYTSWQQVIDDLNLYFQTSLSERDIPVGLIADAVDGNNLIFEVNPRSLLYTGTLVIGSDALSLSLVLTQLDLPGLIGPTAV